MEQFMPQDGDGTGAIVKINTSAGGAISVEMLQFWIHIW